MGSRLLLNLGLVILLAALAAVVTLEPGINKTPPPGKLTVLDRKNITHIELERKDKPALVFERRQDTWMLLRDTPLRAAEFKLKALLNLLDQQWMRKYADSELNADNVGLEHPDAVIRYNKSTEIVFGATDALEGHRYIGINDAVYMVSDNTLPVIKGNWSSFVSTRLFPENASIETIELPDHSLYKADGRWHVEPDRKDISADDITLLIDSWQHASALWVTETTDDGDNRQIKFTLSNHTDPIILNIMEVEPELVLARKDLNLQYYLSGDSAQHLLNIPQPDPTDNAQEH